MAINNGTDVLIKVGGTVVDGQTNADFEWITDMLDATTKDSSGHKDYIAGEDGGTLNVEGKVDETDTQGCYALLTLQQAKAAVAVIFGRNVAGAKTISCNALFSNVKIAAPQNGVQTWSANMQITGNITQGTVAA